MKKSINADNKTDAMKNITVPEGFKRPTSTKDVKKKVSKLGSVTYEVSFNKKKRR